jgi:predicted RNase H-like nuclease (RuvC/YqgF family)
MQKNLHQNPLGKGDNILSMGNQDRSRQNLQQQSNELAERMLQIEEQSENGNMNQNDLEAEIREVKARVEMLTREMNRHVVPPSYASSEHGEGVQSSRNSI